MSHKHPFSHSGNLRTERIDSIGPLPQTQSGKEYIIMGVDYMTRWAEVQSPLVESLSKMLISSSLNPFVSSLAPLLRSFLIGGQGLEPM